MPELLEEIKKLLGDQGPQAMEKQAAVCLLLRPSKSGELFDLLYMERADAPGDYWAGQIGFPGGKRDLTDTDIEFTADREFQEEMGESLSIKAKLLGKLDSIQGRRSGALMDFTIHPFVYFTDELMNFNPDPAEVGAYHWIPIENILDPKYETSFKLKYKSGVVDLPGLDFPNKKVLWGLTYMITKDLFKRLASVNEVQNLHSKLSSQAYLAHLKDYPG